MGGKEKQKTSGAHGSLQLQGPAENRRARRRREPTKNRAGLEGFLSVREVGWDGMPVTFRSGFFGRQFSGEEASLETWKPVRLLTGMRDGNLCRSQSAGTAGV